MGYFRSNTIDTTASLSLALGPSINAGSHGNASNLPTRFFSSGLQNSSTCIISEKPSVCTSFANVFMRLSTLVPKQSAWDHPHFRHNGRWSALSESSGHFSGNPRISSRILGNRPGRSRRLMQWSPCIPKSSSKRPNLADPSIWVRDIFYWVLKTRSPIFSLPTNKRRYLVSSQTSRTPTIYKGNLSIDGGDCSSQQGKLRDLTGRK